MKRINLILNLFTNLYMISLIFKAGLFKSNLSGISEEYYIYILILGLLLIITNWPIVNKLCRKEKYLFILSILLAVSIPYIDDNIYLMNVHIMACYVGFALLNYILLLILYRYKLFNKKYANSLFKIYFMMMVVLLMIYTKTLSIIGLMEVIFLLTISLIFGIINYDLC